MRPFLLVLLIPLLLLGCEGFIGPDDGVAGKYTLIQVDGMDLPASVGEQDGCEVEETGGTLRLMESGRFTQTWISRWTCPDEILNRATTEESGVYSVSGDAVELVYDRSDIPPSTGTLTGRQVSVDFGGHHTYTYRR